MSGAAAFRFAGAVAAGDRALTFFFAAFFAGAFRLRTELAAALRTAFPLAAFFAGAAFFRDVVFLAVDPEDFDRRVEAFTGFALAVFRVFFLAGLMLGPSL